MLRRGYLSFFGLILVSTFAFSLVANVGSAEVARASGVACVSSGNYDDGVGSDADPFQIATAGQLQHFASHITSTFGTANSGLINNKIVLTASIDMNGCAFASNGAGVPFRGKFDGQNFSISNLAVTKNGASQAGLFSTTEPGAEIRNLRLVSPSVTSGSWVGALIGEGEGTVLQNITVTDATIIGSASIVGAIAGALTGQAGKTTERLVVTGSNVYGTNMVGGLFGLVSEMNLTEASFSEGQVNLTTTSSSYVGGLVGWFGSAASSSRVSSTVQRASFAGSVAVGPTGTTHAGLFFGNLRNAAVTLVDSYARGAIKTRAGTLASGVAGNLDSAGVGSTVSLNRVYVQGSYYLMASPTTFVNARAFATSVASSNSSFYDSAIHTMWSSTVGGSAKSTAELLDPATFAAPFTVTQDVDAVRAQATPAEVWFMNEQVESGYPVHVWAYRAGVHAVECPVGRFSVDGLVPCVDASPGNFVSTTGATAEQACPAGTTSDAGAASCFALATASPDYQGPVIAGALAVGAVGEQVVLSGSRMGQVSSVSIAGITSPATCSETSCSFIVPLGAPSGLQDLLLLGGHGVLTIQDGIRVNPGAALSSAGFRVSTRDLGDGSVKVYARGVVGVGKVQFFVNGREVAWVRAADGSDPKLRTPSAGPMAGVSYLVRTVPLVAGKNTFEVHVDGQRVLRRVATG